MSISGIGSATGVQVDPTQMAEQQNGGNAPKAASTAPANSTDSALTGGQSSQTGQSSQSTTTQIQTYANQGLTAAQIAQMLGMSVLTVEQDAQAAGISLSNGNSTPAQSGNPSVGNNINTTA